MRAVSLVPSITETLRAWGLDPIACTKYCEQSDLLHVGGTKNPDIEAIVALAPDVVLLDRVENRKEDAEALRAAGVHVVDISVEVLTDVVPEMTTLANAVQLDADLAARCGIDHEPASPSATAFVPIWRRPWMTIGAHTYGSTLLAHLGVTNVFADAAVDFPEVTLDDVAARQPDVILVPSEPYEFTDAHLDELRQATDSDVERVDGQDVFWWGARTPAAADRLADSLSAAVNSGFDSP